MRAGLVGFGCCLVVMALTAGCETLNAPPPPQGDPPLAQDPSNPLAVLENELARAGLGDTDLVFETTMTFPVPSGGDTNTRPTAWKGVFLGRTEATLHAQDQVLVIAKTWQCNESGLQYMYNPFTRTWGYAAQHSSQEPNRLWVLFSGTAADFFRDVAAKQEARCPLTSVIAKTKPIVPGTLPADISVDRMLADLTEEALTAMDAHLKAEHTASNPCNPDMHVYIKPAASR